MSFGAYYGANTTIEQAAAGLGSVPPRVEAYRSGSLGAYRKAGAAAGRRAGVGEYFSGVLGQPPIESHDEGVLGQPPIDAYKDGVFAGAVGFMPPSVEAYRSGSLGAEAARGIGMPPPVEAYRSGSLGYATGLGPTKHDVLLADPETLKEVKTVIGMHPALFQLTATAEGQKTWPSDFYTYPKWDVRADALWDLMVGKFPQLKSETQAFGTLHRGPTAGGLKFVLASGFGMPTLASQFTPEVFPSLYPWYKNVLHGASSQVIPPITEEESAGFDMKRAAMWGVGGIAVVALGMAFFGKKSHA